MTAGTISMHRTRKIVAAPAPGPAPGQKPSTAATPMSSTNSTVITVVIRRGIVPDDAFEPISASVWDWLAIDRLVQGTNTEWCTALMGHWDRNESTGRRRHWVH